MDPLVIDYHLEELIFNLEYFSNAKKSILEANVHQQRVGEEYAERALMTSIVRHTEALDNVEAAQSQLNGTHLAVNLSQDTITEAEAAIKESEAAEEQASHSYKYWQHQLELARRWESRALDSLRAAERQLSSAKSTESRCQSKVYSAQKDLSDARWKTKDVYLGRDSNDNARYRKEPIDTTPYENALRSAEYELSQAKTLVRNAQIDVDDANRELKKAQKQVAGSKRAVNDSQEACRLATTACRDTKEAHRYATISNDCAKLAVINSEKALHFFESEEALCTASVESSRSATELMQQSRHHLSTMDSAVHDSVSRSREANQFLLEKRTLLQAFDTPML